MSEHICECNWLQKPEDLPEEGATVGCEPLEFVLGIKLGPSVKAVYAVNS